MVEALDHPHTAHRGMVAEVDGFRSVASPVKLDRTPASYRLRPQEIGRSSVEVLESLEGAQSNPHCGRVMTASDLVYFFNCQSEAAPQPTAFH